jgi:Asp/Glu/hydantoin racemase
LSLEFSCLVRDTAVIVRVLLVGPTSAPWTAVAGEVEADLARLARSTVVLSYRCTGAGPRAVHTAEDAIEAAPYVVRAVVDAADKGFDGVIVDCTADPGVVEARKAVTIPVVGAAETLWAAIDSAPTPVYLLTGDELRTLELDAILEQTAGAATVALGGTGYSHLVGALVDADPQRVVLDPLDQALEVCLARLG